MRRIAVVGTVGLPACYGGFESLVENLTSNAKPNQEYIVFCTSRAYERKVGVHNGARLIYLPLEANGIQSIFYDALSLLYTIFLRPNTILVLGVSGCVVLPLVRLLSSARIVTNIDGLEWRRKKWGRVASWFLKLSEWFAVRFSHQVITDNEAITNYVKSNYNSVSTTIAYGGDNSILLGSEIPQVKDNYFLGLCRIEPENSVAEILEAFSIAGLQLKFVGNWNNSDYGKNLRRRYDNIEHIELLDPIYDPAELFDIRAKCAAYIHGHSAGGTNPSLVEMMHFGVPVVAYDCDFNRFSTCDGAIYFSDVDSLTKILLNDSVCARTDVGAKMKEIAKDKYTWKRISQAYSNVY